MSWLSGLKPSTASISEQREERRRKLDEDRLLRAKNREQQRKQLQAAIQAQEEANKACKELLAIDPNLFEGDSEISEVSEDRLEELAKELLEEPIMANFALIH